MPKRLLAIALLAPLATLAAEDARPPALKLAGGEFRPTAAEASDARRADDAERRTSPRGERYLVAIADGPLGPEQRLRLERAGAELLGYLPDHGYRLRLHPRAEPAVRGLDFVRWLGEMPARHKVAPALASRAPAGASAERIRVLLAPGEPLERVLAVLGPVEHAAPAGRDGAWRAVATVGAQRLAATLDRLAELPEVEAIEPVRPVVPLNQDGVWVHQSFVGPAPQSTPIFDRGLYGCGQILSVADTAQDHDACYFADPLLGPPPVSTCFAPPCPAAAPALDRRKDVLYYNWSGGTAGEEDTCPTLLLGGSGHGTHTSGSAAGDRAPYADCATFTGPGRNGGDGQAPGARLVMLELGDALEYLNDLGGTLWNVADVAYRSGARIHSFSFGGVCHDALGQCVPGCTLPYDSLARDADLAMWTYPDLLLVNAAGNAGTFCDAPSSIVTPALAKSLLAVGGLEHGTSAGAVMPESSRGPVGDGRLRPTVAAQGRAVVSAASDASPTSGNCSSCSLDGTSMAAPTVAGLAALVREYYTAGYLAAGARDPSLGFTPSGALLKATLIDAAVDLGAAGADFDSGFGRVQLDRTLAFAGGPFRLWVDDHREGLGTGGVVHHAFDVSGGEPLRVTLVWTDYPAEINAATARVNELRLEVIDPAGNLWFQTLGPAGAPVPTADPGDAHDALNTEERLVFADPAPGRWAVRVRGVSVPWGPQPFALVVRGDLDECAAPAAPASPSAGAPADGQVALDWPAVPGAAAYNVYRSLGGCPGGPWIPVAVATTATTLLDTTVSGGVSYAYRVTATSDPGGFCESEPSPCAAVLTTGECLLAPDFRGAVAAASDGTADCAVMLDWAAGSNVCAGGEVVYNVYRGAASGFVPGAENRVASCLTGTSYRDSVGLAHGEEYHWVVRAEDATAGHGGPCRGGNEDPNRVEVRAAPYGPAATGTWSDDAGDTGVAALARGSAWFLDETGGNAGPRVYRGASSQLVCSELTTPVLSLADPGQGPQLTFSTTHALDYDPGFVLFYEGSIGQVEIATGPAFSNWTRVPLTPDYPTYVDAPFYTGCSTTQSIGNYFSDVDLTWDSYSASLVNWGGEEVKLRFRLSGDLYFYGGAWWIDDVQVTQVGVPGTCATTASGPPPVPDGASVPGEPLRVAKSGSDVQLSWDAARCPSVAVNVYRGAIGDYSAFEDGACDLPASGSATLALPDDSWFLVVSTDGASTDGSWSRDARGLELGYSGATTVCPSITQHATGGACP